ncbi:hypothetical protein GCM10009850_105850 [Nonomuraea monospora]|uniref:Uncharacterized protein n=1 Tax=Nonomuraea monospora TaxID=568818 RepID=A0ABN3D010_9ACTN
MRDTMRHVIGAVVGLAALPVIYYGLAIASHRLLDRIGDFDVSSEGTGLYVTMLVGVGIVLAVLAGWQLLSPLAPLLAGAGLSLVGGIWAIDPGAAVLELVSFPAASGLVGASGVYLLIGVMMLLLAFVPSRWRSRRAAAPDGLSP